MKFIDREAQYLGRRKITKVGPTDNEPMAGEVPFFVKIEKAEGNIDVEGTPIDAENLNKGNWRDDDSISFKKMDDNYLPNQKTGETQIVTDSDGKTWLIPPLGDGNKVDLTDTVPASVKVGGVKKDIEFTSDPQTQINGKANKTHGSTHRIGGEDEINLANGSMPGLSTNDYTTTEKTKLSGIASGAQVNEVTTSIMNTALDKKVDKAQGTGNAGKVMIVNASGNLEPRSVQTDILAVAYPVGSIYISTVSTNPNTLFGFGTWAAFGAGRVLVGVDKKQTEFNTELKEGGANTVILTEAQMPTHNHSTNSTSKTLTGWAEFRNKTFCPADYAASGIISGSSGQNIQIHTGTNSTTALSARTNIDATHTHTTENKGSGQAHNNLQPYITVYMWNRTA